MATVLDPAFDNIFALPIDEIVHTVLRILSKRTRLIIWGSLLDKRLGLPRIHKNFTFLVPDEELDSLSDILTSMHLPIGALPTYVVRSAGDFLRRGRLHRVSRHTDPIRINCLHLLPASLPEYADEELERMPLEDTTVTLYAPRPSAVYAGLLRMMRKYRRHCAERYRLQSDLELLINYNLLGLEKGFAVEEDYEALGMDQRVETAVERISGWGKAGEWRPGEESVQDFLIAVVKGEMDIGDLPALDIPRDEKKSRAGSNFEAPSLCLPKLPSSSEEPLNTSSFSSSSPSSAPATSQPGMWP